MFESLNERIAYLSRGGPVMGLIILSSMICVALIIERWFSLRREKLFPRSFLNEVEHLAEQKKTEELISLSRSHENPVARILREGLTVPLSEREKKVEQLGKYEVMKMEKFLDMLGLLATVGPLLGLLGTVTGMIRTFGVIEKTGIGDPLKLSGGIAEALLNTAGGLVVAIPAYIFQRWFFRKIDHHTAFMEKYVQRIFDLTK